ncbi:thiamine pyrophosphate-dependent enzyme [Pseudonocardia acaciae]|uniref:thiamine pyrophosphate-dependent enzyme n=1 Tax=Pseudonocardia acaciae TaxID=551276 RepID=UPI0005614CD8|nr:thiamine pyrophosphate-dependent enzyme [Pseudonocardia acaciae]
MTVMTGGEALARQLVAEGVTDVFGVPGVQLDAAIDGIAGLGGEPRYIVTRHEQAAAYMADGYARATGRIGVCMVVPGPGVLNTLAALSTAYACSSPVLLIAGQIPSPAQGRNLGLLHEIPDQAGMLASLTKRTLTARSPEQIPGLVREAVRELRTGRPRPVALQVPPDVLAATADMSPRPSSPPDDHAPLAPDPDTVRAAAELLRAARRPAVYAGWGVQAADATAELRALAELLTAPVVTSLTGPGAIPGDHPLAFAQLAGRTILRDADLVLAVGSRFLDGRGRPEADIPLILLNADAADLGPPRTPSVAVHADARLGLAALTRELAGAAPEGWPEHELAAARRRYEHELSWCAPQLEWLAALREAIPPDGVLVSELTQVGYVSALAYPVLAPRTYLTPGYQGTLGYGFATALGAKVGRPDRAVVSITGDGGFGWTMQELATARQHGIGLVTVVFDNGGFGNVKLIQAEQYGGRHVGVDLTNPDFPALAAAFGVTGRRADTPDGLRAAVADALAAGEPALIHVPIGPMPSPWHLIHEWWPVQPAR